MHEEITKQPLTDSQKEVLYYISGYIDEYGHSPKREDIAEEFETGLNNVSRYINELCEKGWITKDNSKRPPALTVL